MPQPDPTPRARTLWITGLPGAGKRTLARALEGLLALRGQRVARLDSGALRRELLPELPFTPEARRLQTLHLAHTAQQLNQQGVTAVVHAVSPSAADRAQARGMLPGFVEVWLNTPIDVCVERGEGGLWDQALAGDVLGFTGVDARYEPPPAPELCLDGARPPLELVDEVLAWLEQAP